MNGQRVGRFAVEYVLPLRWDDDRDCEELTRYLHVVSSWADVTVVDGSDTSLFAAHHRAWDFVRHVSPDWDGANGKARGVMTGLAISRHERVIIADDDVRYDAASLRAGHTGLDQSDFVRSATRRGNERVLVHRSAVVAAVGLRAVHHRMARGRHASARGVPYRDAVIKRSASSLRRLRKEAP